MWWYHRSSSPTGPLPKNRRITGIRPNIQYQSPGPDSGVYNLYKVERPGPRHGPGGLDPLGEWEKK